MVDIMTAMIVVVRMLASKSAIQPYVGFGYGCRDLDLVHQGDLLISSLWTETILQVR